MSDSPLAMRRAVVARRLEMFSQPLDAADMADAVGEAFSTLAREVRGLRGENARLRAALAECVEACGDYLAPMLPHEIPDADDPAHTRARVALRDARRLLSMEPTPATPSLPPASPG